MKQHLSIWLCIAIVTGLLPSCHFGVSGGWKDDRIDPKIRVEIHQLDEKLFNALANNDIPGVKDLASEALVKKMGLSIDTLVINTSNVLKGVDHHILNDFYTKNTTTNITNTVFSGLGNRDYIINYLALNEEMAVSTMVSKNQPVKYLILAIYGKYSNGWKLNILRIGEYEILGKTAPEYAEDAARDHKKGYLINAADKILIASELGRPGGDHLRYKNDSEMKDLYTKIINEANTTYHFPITMKGVIKEPQIFGVSPHTITEPGNQGVYPVISYLTTISLKDTVA